MNNVSVLEQNYSQNRPICQVNGAQDDTLAGKCLLYNLASILLFQTKTYHCCHEYVQYVTVFDLDVIVTDFVLQVLWYGIGFDVPTHV
jgi:hypothetical protein